MMFRTGGRLRYGGDDQDQCQDRDGENRFPHNKVFLHDDAWNPRNPSLLPLVASAAPALRSNMLVTTDWLGQHLNDPKLVVLHVSANRARV